MVGWFRSRGCGRKTTVSAERVRILDGMQEIFSVLRPSQRPVVLFPPLIGAHHENLYWFTGKFILNPLEKVLIPLQGKIIFIVFSRGLSKVHIADLSPVASVSPDGHKEMLAATRCFAFIPM